MHITPFLEALVLNMPRPLQFCSVGVNISKEVERQEVKKKHASILQTHRSDGYFVVALPVERHETRGGS